MSKLLLDKEREGNFNQNAASERIHRDIRDFKHRQRNARRRSSQPKEDWVEGFVLCGKNESQAVCCFEATTIFGSLTSCSFYGFQKRPKSASN